MERFQLFPALGGKEYEALKQDIAAHGLLVPLEVDEQGELIDGFNRRRICQELGITPITVTRHFENDRQRLEHAWSLNGPRRHLNESQRAMVAARMATMGEGRPSKTSGIPLVSQSDAAAITHVSVDSVKKAKRVQTEATAPVVALVDAGTLALDAAAKLLTKPPEFQVAVAEKVAAGARPQEASRQVIAEQAAAAPSLPETKYRVVYADPPWRYGNTQPDYHPEQRDHYPAMSVDEIAALPIATIVEDNAVLFLWVTSPVLEESFGVVQRWGFSYKASFVWDKVKHNMGHYNSVRHEFLLVCTRGSCLPDKRRLYDSVVSIERSEHSRKPDYFREMIDDLYPAGRRVELFARAEYDGWETWGNEIPGFKVDGLAGGRPTLSGASGKGVATAARH